MIRRRQFSARTSDLCDLNMAVVQVVAARNELSLDAYLEVLIRTTIRKIRTGEIDRSHLQDTGALTRMSRCMLPAPLIEEMHTIAGRVDLSAADIFRAAIRYESELRERIELERKYSEAGASGNPVLMSDAFLRLWERNQEGKATPVEIEIYRHVRPLQVELSELRDMVTQLHDKETRQAGTKPRRQDIALASLSGLRDLGREWGFEIPKKSKIAIARRQALTHFGYATTE